MTQRQTPPPRTNEMTKPAMIRSFFEKIEKAAATGKVVSAPAPVAAVVTVSIPETPAYAAVYEEVEIPSFSKYNDTCPPLTTRNTPAAKAMFNDFGVGLPPMAGSFA